MGQTYESKNPGSTRMEANTFRGRLLYDWFHLETDAGMRLLTELTDASGVDTGNRCLDTAQCTGKVLRVTVRHREGKDSKLCFNATRYAPAQQARWQGNRAGSGPITPP